MKPTKGSWKADLMIIDGKKCPDYFHVSAGHGFLESVSQRGFGATAYMAADDAALMGNAKAMYDVLKRLSKKEAYYNFQDDAKKVLDKIEKAFNRLEKENAKAKKAAANNGGA